MLGRRGKYSGGAILTTLQRHRLAVADPNPEDGRKRRYSGVGDFSLVDWTNYLREYAETCRRFEQLNELVALSGDEIPAAIDEYFDVQSGEPVAV